ncbi:hypothetical protein JST56_07415 [Candidatus Dependentiae bacterium]|nr:hypothetical protein [Candidatus Dependentiae bacterium]
MKKLMLFALIAINGAWTTDRLFAMDQYVEYSSDEEGELSDNYGDNSDASNEFLDVIPASQNRRTPKKEKKEKKSDNKKPGKGGTDVLGTIVDTAKAAYEFEQAHQDQIISGVKTAVAIGGKIEEAADKVIGDGDGDLTFEEVKAFLKKIGKGLGKVKNLVAGAFKKDKPVDSLSSDSAPVTRSTRRSGSKEAASGIVDKAAAKAKKALTSLKYLLEGEVAYRLLQLENTRDQALELFIQNHSDLQAAVQHLLDRLNGKHMRGLPDRDIKVLNEFIDALTAAQNGGEDSGEVVVDEHDDIDVIVDGKNLLDVAYGAEEFIDEHQEELQAAGGFFERLIDYQDADGKITVSDIPEILKALIKKIGKVKGLLGKLGSKKKEAPKRSLRPDPVDDAAMVQVKSGLLAIGTRLQQLSVAFGVSPKELQQVIKGMEVAELHKYLNEGDEEQDVLSLNAQIEKYTKMCGSQRTPVNPQAIAECLKVTLAFATHLQEACSVVEVVATGAPQTRYGRFASKINCRRAAVGLGVLITGVTALLAGGEQLGWWDIYPA